MIIAVDFDGTIVEHRYPEIGEALPGAIEYLKEFQAKGAQLILHTMRGALDELAAVMFCRAAGLSFWGVNENPEQKAWTVSPKIYAHLYIDDAALGCPLALIQGGRPAVDWSVVGPRVLNMIELERQTGSR